MMAEKMDKSATNNKQENNINSDSDDSDDSQEIRCETCNKKFSGVSSYEIHMNSGKHRKQVQALKIKKDMKSGSHSNDKADETENKETNGDDIDAIYCSVCKLSCCGYVSYKQHLQSSKHLKNLNRLKLDESLKNTPEVQSERKKREAKTEDEDEFPSLIPYGHCQICSKTFYGPESLKKHMDGASHKRKMDRAKIKENLKSNIEKNSDSTVEIVGDDNVSDEDILAPKNYGKCQTCDKKFSGPESLKIHLESEVHRKKVENLVKMTEIKNKHGDKYDELADGKFECKECKKQFLDFQSLVQHLRSNLHSKKATKKNIADSLDNYPEITVMKLSVDNEAEKEHDDSEEVKDYYVCKLCKGSFSGPECALQHVHGRKHKRAKEIKEKLKNMTSSPDDGQVKKKAPSMNSSLSNDGNVKNKKEQQEEKNNKNEDHEDDDFEVVG